MTALFNRYAADRLTWLPELGLGWYPTPTGDAVYNRAYWERYQAMDATPMGRELTDMRAALVAEHYGDGQMVDVGIGGGAFVMARPRTYGADINPHAIQWLQDVGMWHPGVTRLSPVIAASFWDSLEHIHDPTAILAHVLQWVFVSLPIFRGPDHVLASKHFRKDEHCWYFTHDGFIRFMRDHGFLCRHWDVRESDAGREDIRTYAFRRLRA